MKYKKTYDGEWFAPRRKKWFMRCCQCGLTHIVNFKLKKYKNGHRILMQANLKK